MSENKIKKAVKKQFSEHAADYVKSESHANGNDLPKIVEWLEPKSEWVALDIATGGGHVANTLAPHVGTMFSTDLTEKMLEKAAAHLNKEHHNIFYVLADAEELPFLSNTFDCVTCRIAPHHFPNPDKFIAEVARVLKEDGKFILIDNIAPSNKELADYMNTFEKLRDESHVRCLSKKDWEELFATNGLMKEREMDRRKKHDYSTWVRRLLQEEEKIKRVSTFILNGSQETKDYFSVKIVDNEVESVEIDEWMVLCKPIKS
jgi:ubiquinone/menaquinone biosynthesis C-methylase UbiE